MLEERRLRVLRAIVQDHVSTSEPVGSKALLERHSLGVSAATVRNDMAALEEEGLIAAPHTSAGRIPTDAGYRIFVDRLGQIRPLSRAQREAIKHFLADPVDLDDVVERTARLLAAMTNQVAVMQYPSLNRSTVRHVELVSMGGNRVMVVLILSSGRVEQRVVHLHLTDAEPGSDGDAVLDEATLDRLRARLNEVSDGRLLSEASEALQQLPQEFAPQERDAVDMLVHALTDVLLEQREERVVLAGTSNLARTAVEPGVLAPVLEALEQHVVLLRLLESLDPDADHDTVAVRIGSEHSHVGLHGTSVVTTKYGTGGVAGLGVLGPTRMDYPSTMAAVRAVARYISEIVEQ